MGNQWNLQFGAFSFVACPHCGNFGGLHITRVAVIDTEQPLAASRGEYFAVIDISAGAGRAYDTVLTFECDTCWRQSTVNLHSCKGTVSIETSRMTGPALMMTDGAPELIHGHGRAPTVLERLAEAFPDVLGSADAKEAHPSRDAPQR